MGDRVPDNGRPVHLDRRAAELAGLGEHFLSHGLVGVGDLLATVVPDPLPVLRAAAAAGPFPRTARYLGRFDADGPVGGPAVAQALLLSTGRAAAVAPLPGLGRIRPGGDGSFVVAEPDPLSVPPDELDRVRVHQTWVRGTLAFRR